MTGESYMAESIQPTLMTIKVSMPIAFCSLRAACQILRVQLLAGISPATPSINVPVTGSILLFISRIFLYQNAKMSDALVKSPREVLLEC